MQSMPYGVLFAGCLCAGCCRMALVAGGCSRESAATATRGTAAGGKGKPRNQMVIAMLPKLTNIAYFRASQEGAKKAAEELGVKLIYDGPSEPSASEQNKFMETWIRQGVDAICVAPNEPKAIKRFVQECKAAASRCSPGTPTPPRAGGN